jgi:hypothetical protein
VFNIQIFDIANFELLHSLGAMLCCFVRFLWSFAVLETISHDVFEGLRMEVKLAFLVLLLHSKNSRLNCHV